MRKFFALFLVLAPAIASAHDTWVQANVSRVRVGEVVHVDLMLGNHGNEHRDFKLASKITLAPCTLSVIDGQGQKHDLKGKVVDTGYAPKEGFWSARFVTKDAGLHTVVHTLDTLHGSTRAIKSAKSYFSAGMDSEKTAGFDKPQGLPIELVPLTNPATFAAGQPIKVRLLYQGKPLPEARVSFIPRGQVLAEGFDKDFERMTDAEGVASFTPADGNYVLVVVHHMAPEQKGEGYEKTAYSATLVANVPQLAPGHPAKPVAVNAK